MPPAPPPAPTPLLDATQPADWIFVYKFNASTFPTTHELTSCMFGGTPSTDKSSQAFAFASSRSSTLVKGNGLIGTSLNDPVGATFNEIYNSSLSFVVWNDPPGPPTRPESFRRSNSSDNCARVYFVVPRMSMRAAFV